MPTDDRGAPSDPTVTDEPVGDEPAVADNPTRADGEYIVAIVFDKPGRANEVLVNVTNMVRDGVLGVTDAVVIDKDENGRGRVQQTVEITPGRGALIGGWLGIIAGLFAGPAAPLVLAGGAAAGALYGKLVDRGLDDSWIKAMAEWLEPDHSALLLLGSVHDRDTALRELGRYEGKVVSTDLPDWARTELEQALAEELPSPDA